MRKFDTWIRIRISTAQHTAWRAEARQRGESVSALVRAALLGRAIRHVPKLNQEAWRTLAATAANLNQIAHNLNAANQQGNDALLAAARDDAAAILSELAGLRAALVGATLAEVRE